MIRQMTDGSYPENSAQAMWNTYLTIIGESADKTIITYNDYLDKMNLG